MPDNEHTQQHDIGYLYGKIESMAEVQAEMHATMTSMFARMEDIEKERVKDISYFHATTQKHISKLGREINTRIDCNVNRFTEEKMQLEIEINEKIKQTLTGVHAIRQQLEHEIDTNKKDVDEHIKKTKWVGFPYKYPRFTVGLALGFLFSLVSPFIIYLVYHEQLKKIVETLKL